MRSPFPEEALAVAKLDLADVLRSRWLAFAVVVYAGLAGSFVLVGMRESTVIGFSGLGRVLLSLVHTLVLVLPLLALAATAQLINRARDDGTLELIFSHPVRRGSYFLAVTATRYFTLAGPLVVLMLAMGLVGRFVFGQDVSWPFLLQAIVISATLVFAYVGLGLMVSTLVRNQTRAVIWVLLLWALGAALVDFGLIGAMLTWRLNAQTVFLLAALNPVQAARMALLAGASSEVSVLGPVGFYLAHQIGPAGLYALGTLWPTAVGVGSWFIAVQHFRRADIV